jgi:preprotein translocase subunit SecY
LFNKIANIFRVPDLKKKVLFTAFILVLYRLGSFIPVPGVDTEVLGRIFSSNSDGLLGLVDLFAGGNMSKASVFALGIMPYITASIVIQLLGSVVPYFEKLKKEGAEGQKKITQITRYGTVLVAALNSIGICAMLISQQGIVTINHSFFFISTIITLITGVMIIMWLGEQITEKGIGNGISLIIFAGIIARLPGELFGLAQRVIANPSIGNIFMIIFVLVAIIGVTASVILVTEAIRKIPVQYAKRVIGRKVYGGQSTYIPLRVNTAGVIPIIFAQSVLMFPITIVRFFNSDSSFVTNWFSPGTALYTICSMTLIIFFAYFYTAMVMNPVEMADNMKKYGGFIPGVKQGKRTAEYINRVLVRITLPGAIFYAIIAVMPDILFRILGVRVSVLGGTSIIIVVGVALDTLQQIESHLVSRHYDGFMKRGKLRGRSGR